MKSEEIRFDSFHVSACPVLPAVHPGSGLRNRFLNRELCVHRVADDLVADCELPTSRTTSRLPFIVEKLNHWRPCRESCVITGGSCTRITA